jgi:hypothetical protein
MLFKTEYIDTWLLIYSDFLKEGITNLLLSVFTVDFFYIDKHTYL